MITFTVASDTAEDVGGWRVEHAFGVTTTDFVHPTETAALGELLEHNVRCGDQWCLRHGGYISPVMIRSFGTVEVTDAIAPMLCALLSLKRAELNHGVFDAEVEHALLHRAAVVVGGRGALVGTASGAEEHLMDLLDELAALGAEARRAGREIVSA